MKVGGASGPLYGTLFMALGKELPAEPDRAAICRGLRQGDRGGQGARQVAGRPEDHARRARTRCRRRSPAGRPAAAIAERRRDAAAEATVPMKAIRGRASFLGERSIGHMDPGARSSALMIARRRRRVGG